MNNFQAKRQNGRKKRKSASFYYRAHFYSLANNIPTTKVLTQINAYGFWSIFDLVNQISILQIKCYLIWMEHWTYAQAIIDIAQMATLNIIGTFHMKSFHLGIHVLQKCRCFQYPTILMITHNGNKLVPTLDIDSNTCL